MTKKHLSIAAFVLLSGATLPPPQAHSEWTKVAEDWQATYPKGVPDNVRNWFRSVQSPNKVPCCNEADGHPTDEDWRQDGSTWVPNPFPDHAGEWVRVPDEVIIYDQGNPTGRAVAWWVQRGDAPDHIFWRCYVHGSGT